MRPHSPRSAKAGTGSIQPLAAILNKPINYYYYLVDSSKCRRNKACLNVRPPVRRLYVRMWVRPSTNSFSIWTKRSMSDTRRYGMPYDPIQGQGQGHGGRKYACNQKTDGELWYSKTIEHLNFNRTDFWYSSAFGVTWPSNLGSFTFGKRVLPLTRSRTSCTGLTFKHFFYFIRWVNLNLLFSVFSAVFSLVFK